jgi:hypothetical protein
MVAYPQGQIRAVTHYGIEAADIERVLQVVAHALSGSPVPGAAVAVGAATAAPAG